MLKLLNSFQSQSCFPERNKLQLLKKKSSNLLSHKRISLSEKLIGILIYFLYPPVFLINTKKFGVVKNYSTDFPMHHEYQNEVWIELQTQRLIAIDDLHP